MAIETVTAQDAAASSSAEQEQQREVLHEPFEWFPGVPHDATVSATQSIAFTSRTRDIAAGVATVLEIIERDEIDSYLCEADMKPAPRLVSETATGTLFRLCITSLQMLNEEAERAGERAWRRAKQRDTH